MKYIWTCRRTFLAVFAISGLFFLGYGGSGVSDIATAIATIVVGIAGANAYSEVGRSKSEGYSRSSLRENGGSLDTVN